MGPKKRPRRGVMPAIGALGMGLGVAVALATSASPSIAGGAAAAGSASPAPDAGALSSIAARAQKSEVAPPELGQVERMCALLTSCDDLPIPPSLVPEDFAGCVKKMTEELSSPTAISFSLTLRECGLQSESCSSLRACAMHGAAPGACAGRGKQAVVGFCDVDGRALTCWHEQMLAVRDCPRGGEQCLVVGGQATCTLGACPATIAEGDKPRCSGSGTHLLHCEKGKLASLDCAAFGLKCAAGADGAAGCATAGPPCPAGAARCEGSVSVGCVYGHEVRVDCAAGGLGCSNAPGAGAAVGACVAAPPAGGACDPNEKAQCEDGAIRYCAAGRPRSYSCKAVGFGRCDASKGVIRCAP